MLSVKLVRSLVLGETLINNHDNTTNTITPDDYDADDDDDIKKPKNINKKRRMPLLLFMPTKELISDTFRLASIARDIGMDFHPSPSLSHLLFSWPSSSSPSLPSCSPPPPPPPPSSSSSSSSSNNRPSVSSTTTSSTTSSSLWGPTTLPNDAVPLPFPSLSTHSSISLLRYFVSLSKPLFKLVFLETPANLYNYSSSSSLSTNFSLFSKVSRKKVNSMEEFSRVLAGNGWAMYRSSEETVFLFRKSSSNPARDNSNGGKGGGECRIREMRLPVLDFNKGVSLRVLQYILLMTDNVFYIA